MQRKVLKTLAEEYGSESDCFYFRGLTYDTGLTIREIRLACRALTRKGLAEYVKGLFDEDGKVAGSGYRATEVGAVLVKHCDLCNKWPVYDYDGKLECEEHYGKSKKQYA